MNLLNLEPFEPDQTPGPVWATGPDGATAGLTYLSLLVRFSPVPAVGTDLLLRKTDGGDAGHKGVRSVIMALGTGHFSRIRIGVKQRRGNESINEYVLRAFDSETQTEVHAACHRACQIVDQIWANNSKTESMQ